MNSISEYLGESTANLPHNIDPPPTHYATRGHNGDPAIAWFWSEEDAEKFRKNVPISEGYEIYSVDERFGDEAAQRILDLMGRKNNKFNLDETKQMVGGAKEA